MRTILLTIKLGWARALEAGVEVGTDEVELNEWLRDGMRDEVNSWTDGRMPRFIVARGTECRTPGATRPDGRTDITLYFSCTPEKRSDHDSHAIIECKRVSGRDARLCREYVNEGIGRFERNKYAALHVAGFMVGYLESGDTESAVRRINRYLVSKNRDSEQLGPAVAVDEEWARHSRHPREGGGGHIALHHVFLAFRVSRS